MEVLFLSHRIPYPPDRGDSIRSWNLLCALASRMPVHCGSLVEQAGQTAPAIAAVTISHCLAPRPASIGWAGIAALATGRPVSVEAFRSARLRRWVRQTLATRPIDTIFVFSGQMAQYVPADFRGRVVMDFVDVDSAKYEAYAAAARSWWVRAIHAREGRMLSAFEARAAKRAHLSLLITPEERDLFVSRLPDPAGIRVEVLGNGIDATRFSPDAVAAEPGLPAPVIAFTGQMDYAPNVEAVRLFATEVMPAIRARHPRAVFAIVGRAPAAEVRALDGLNGTRVTGEVADVRPWLKAADLVVAPLTIARGVQNKVLEAMAMGRPVLLTTEAATGIAARDGEHFAIADGVPALTARALELLDNPGGMGAAARNWVLTEMGWDRVLAPLPAMMGWADAG